MSASVLQMGHHEVSARQAQITFFVVALIFTSLNLTIFSTDDLFIYARSGLNGRFLLSQAGEGRYSFAAVCQLIRSMGLSVDSYLTISVVLFSMSLSVLYMEVLRHIRVERMVSALLGFLAFLLFGFNLDLYQFTFAQLSYGISFLCLALALRIASRRESGFVRSILLCTMLSAIAIGSYQLYVVYAVFVVLSIVFIKRLEDGTPAVDLRFVATIVIGDLIGSIIYSIINGTLHAIHVPGFAAYPRREQGFRFIAENVRKYLHTIAELMSLSDNNEYSSLLPITLKIILIALILRLVIKAPRQGFSSCMVLMSVIMAIILLWANPINMLLSSYWPSARSLAMLGIFVGALVATYWERTVSSREQSRQANVDVLLVLLFVSLEATNAVVRLRDRSIRQTEDITLAQSIISEIQNQNEDGGNIPIIVGTNPAGNGRYSETVYDFGRSMFQTSWSAPALLEYVSNESISAKYDLDNQCAYDAHKKYTIAKTNDHFLVCINY